MRKKDVFALLVIFILILIYELNGMSEYPKTHAWAQSDRYALSLGFLDNGFDFFHPQTFVLNKQFPGDFKLPSENSITAVDFPIHEFFIAGLMKVFSTSNPIVFRLYILLYSLVGLFFLYKSAYLLTNSFSKSLLVFLFAASSPIYMYYQSGFLPSIPSISNAAIGLFFLIRYFKSNSIKIFYCSVAFFTLASLSRTPFAIYLIALICFCVLILINKKKIAWKVYLALGTSVFILLGYFIYNSWLRNEYGSMFLGHIMIPETWQEFIDIFNVIRDKWLYQYFTKIHYLYLIIVVLVSVAFIIIQRLVLNKQLKGIGLFLGIVMVGTIAYSILMFRQFLNHDYYFLDTFYLPVVFLFSLSISKIPPLKFKFEKAISFTTVIILSLPLFLLSNNIQKDRSITGYWARAQSTIENFTDSKPYLDSLEIASNDKILVLDAYAPNIPFILMDRYGYVVMTTSKENIAQALSWDYDYLIFQNEFFLSDIYSNYPEIIQKTKVISTNDKITVCMYDSATLTTTLLEYLRLDKVDPLFSEIMTFDTTQTQTWRNANQFDSPGNDHNKVGLITAEDPFGITFKMVNPHFINSKVVSIFIEGKLFSYNSDIHETLLVAQIKEDGETLYYNAFDLDSFLKDPGKWQNFNLSFSTPQIQSENLELSIYVWNKGKNELYYDDIDIKIY